MTLRKYDFRSQFSEEGCSPRERRYAQQLVELRSGNARSEHSQSTLGNRRWCDWPVRQIESKRTIRCFGLPGLVILSMGIAQGSSQIESKQAPRDISSNTDPNSGFWRGVPAIFAGSDANGNSVVGYRTEIRSRWTRENLYFLFICPYVQLDLKPDPITDAETYGLWHWNVAEVFIGSDFRNIRRYREFEISPQGEWTDLDVNLDTPHHEDGWVWNSGFKVSARIDQAAHRWYGFMQIPYSSVDSRPALAGNRLRVNFFLSEGTRSNHKAIKWQSTHQRTFHVPEVFGVLRLVQR